MIIHEATMKLFVILAALSLCFSEELSSHKTVKRSYVCPPRFIRQGHRCYFFSKLPATWQEALFQCRSMHSNLAIIKNGYQDKLIRNFLSKNPLAPSERWLGGVYDWKEMTWKWAASGKKLSYNGIPDSDKDDKDGLRWHCLVMDPSRQYRWNAQPCVERKRYICHTKMKTVTNSGKKKLMRQYHVDKYNKLNEIPVPNIPDYGNGTTPLKTNVPIAYSLNDQALNGYAPAVQKRKRDKNRKKQKMNFVRYANGTVALVPRAERKRKTIKNRNVVPQIQWTTYKKGANPSNPFYPRPLVMEFNVEKDR